MTCISLNLRHIHDLVLLSIKAEVIRFINFSQAFHLVSNNRLLIKIAATRVDVRVVVLYG